MVEIVVALGIMVILAGIILPRVSGYLDTQKADATHAALRELAAAVKAFRTTVGNYPGRISDLSNVIASGDLTACGAGNTYGATNQAKWKNAAPYYPRVTSRTGFLLPIGVANDALTRTSNVAPGRLLVTVPNTKVDDARDLNSLIDGDADQVNETNTTGTVQWSTIPTNGVVTITYGIPVTTAC